ncbi:MAG TPA: DUF5916 domain-containing protein, partial [Flavobacteriales bacterium]|nr:DUF5916 domain-containing protein [Flavobacteriales bacterium]
ILNTQTAFEHLFQRRDATEFRLDSNRTSLSGMGGTVRFGKIGGKGGKLGQVFKFETGVTLRSPGLELNDIGFMLTANEINHFTWAGLHFPREFSVFRNARINYNHWLRWDYSGKLMYTQFNTNVGGAFRNNWQVGTSVTWNPYDVSNNALRGTTALRRPSGVGADIYMTSDTRKKVYVSLNAFSFWGSNNEVGGNNIGVSLWLQPINALSVSLSSNYGYNFRKQDQFVQNIEYNNSIRTIVGEVKQKTLRFTARASYNITPDLTVQYYGQPFITRPVFSKFAYVSSPLAKNYNDRFTPFTASQIQFLNGTYSVDENRDGNVDYRFGMPDFNFVQFRSNLIMRWEYKRGSEFYLVWSQSHTADAFSELETPVFRSLFDNAFGDGTRNIFLVKWMYRFLR